MRIAAHFSFSAWANALATIWSQVVVRYTPMVEQSFVIAIGIMSQTIASAWLNLLHCFEAYKANLLKKSNSAMTKGANYTKAYTFGLTTIITLFKTKSKREPWSRVGAPFYRSVSIR